MKYIYKENEEDIVFYENHLKDAIKYYIPNNSILLEEDFIGDNYELYVKQYKDYVRELNNCNCIEELCDVLNKYTDVLVMVRNGKLKNCKSILKVKE